MASAPQPTLSLPVMYNEIVPLTSVEHKEWKSRTLDAAPWLTHVNAVPLASDEMVLAQRFYPIVFTDEEYPVPLALMGLNEGVNVYVDDDGKLRENVYIPAYVRRYPFLLMPQGPESQDLLLCFDPSSGAIGKFDEGAALFDGDSPSETTTRILEFCEQWEQAWQRTQAFVKEVIDAKLLMDGEVAIQPEGMDQPYVYRGFKMVDENKLRDLRGDQSRKLVQNGVLPLLYAHLFSLSQVSDIFGKQMAQGKLPPQVPTQTN